MTLPEYDLLMLHLNVWTPCSLLKHRTALTTNQNFLLTFTSRNKIGLRLWNTSVGIRKGNMLFTC